jgi:hypothetical protein
MMKYSLLWLHWLSSALNTMPFIQCHLYNHHFYVLLQRNAIIISLIMQVACEPETCWRMLTGEAFATVSTAVPNLFPFVYPLAEAASVA